MSETQLQKFDIATTVTDSLIELFDAMLSMELELSDESFIEGLEGSRIAGSVRLAGKVMGSINIHVTEAFSYQMTASMLGIESDEIEDEDDVRDVISEVCNIVGGNLKSKFCDSGLTCQLSPPSFTKGQDFKIESLNTARHERYVFLHDKEPIIVDVGVRINEDADYDRQEAKAAKEPPKPIDKAAFLTFDIRTPVIHSLVEMFDMMMSMDLTVLEGNIGAELDEDKIVGSVSFIGQLMGSLNVYVSDGFARVMTATMMGMEPGEVEGFDDIRDVISEVCNIVGGNLKSKLYDHGFRSNLSTPSMTIGSDFTIESMNMVKYEKIAFQHNDEMVYVEVGVTVEDEIKSDGSQAGQAAATLGRDANVMNPQKAVEHMIKSGGKTPSPAAPKKPKPEPVDVPPAAGPPAAAEEAATEYNLEFLLDVPVSVTVELGRTRKKIEEVLEVTDGSIVELSKLAHEPVDIRVNDTLIAKGEIVVDNDKYGVRILEIMSRLQRLRSL